MSDKRPEPSRRVPACEDVDVIGKRLKEIRDERERAQNSPEPSEFCAPIWLPFEFSEMINYPIDLRPGAITWIPG